MAFRRFFVSFALVAAAALVSSLPQARPQPPAGGGNYQGFNLNNGVLGDTQRLFNLLARGDNTLAIGDTGILRFALANYARQQAISGDRITKDEFIQFGQQLTMKALFSGSVSQSRIDAVWDQLAEWEFKRKDANSNGVLEQDEMERGLLDNLPQWDLNWDDVIDLNEFKSYYRVKMSDRMTRNLARSYSKGPQHFRPPAAYVIPDLEEFDNRQTVYRYGKLPDGLPEWFTELDWDRDGQIGLYEWRVSGKSAAEFQQMDRNGDGLLTTEELLHFLGMDHGANGGQQN